MYVLNFYINSTKNLVLKFIIFINFIIGFLHVLLYYLFLCFLITSVINNFCHYYYKLLLILLISIIIILYIFGNFLF